VSGLSVGADNIAAGTLAHRRVVALRGYTLTFRDISALASQLQVLIDENRKSELDRFGSLGIKGDQASEVRAAIERANVLWISVFGTNGEEYFTQDLSLATDDVLPKTIKSVLIGSINPHKKEFKVEPPNGLELMLDFSDPVILDWQNAVSAPTSNDSYILAKGRQSWIGSVIQCVEDALKPCRNGRELMHRPFVYDFCLFLCGLPLAFLAVKRLSPAIENIAGKDISTLSVMLNVYVGFGSLWLFRLLFAYSKWVLPVMEITHNERSRKGHRIFLMLIVGALVAEVIHSLLVLVA
jgi:hypothetical protein